MRTHAGATMELTLRDRYESKFLRNDLLIATIAVIAVSAIAFVLPGIRPVADLALRRQLYMVGAGVAATLTGFGLVAVTIIFDLTSSGRLALLRTSPHYPEIFETFVSATRFFAATAAFLVLALLLDAGGTLLVGIAIICLWLTATSAVRFCRCVWIFSRILRIVSKPTT